MSFTIKQQTRHNFEIEALGEAIAQLQLDSAWNIAVRVKAAAERDEEVDPVSFSILADALELTLRRFVFPPINVQ